MLSAAFTRWRRRRESKRRIREELAFHYEALCVEHLARGLGLDEANAEAATRLGDRRSIARTCVAIASDQGNQTPDPAPPRSPALWMAAAVLAPPVLAVLLLPQYFRPSPQPNAERLDVTLQFVPKAFERALFDPNVAAFRRVVTRLTVPAKTEALVAGRLVTSNFFALQGVAPAIGRAPGAGEAVLSYALWRQSFGGDERIIGQRVQLNGSPYTVSGVMAPHYRFLDAFDSFWAVALPDPQRPIDGHLLTLAEGFAAAPAGSRPFREAALARVYAALGVPGYALLLLALLGAAQTLSLALALGPRRVRAWVLIRSYLMLFVKAAPALGVLAVFWLAVRESAALSPISYFSGVASFFLMFVFALLCVAAVWQSLVDQRLRCPICLRKLTMPLPLGVIGSILFEIPGSEYICAYGHGTMFVPEPTSEGVRPPSWSEPRGLWADLAGVSSRS